MRRIVKIAAATRKISIRYSELCGMISDTVDAVSWAILRIGLHHEHGININNHSNTSQD